MEAGVAAGEAALGVVGGDAGRLVGARVTTTLVIAATVTVSDVPAICVAMLEVKSLETVAARAPAEVSVTAPSETTTSKLTAQLYDASCRGCCATLMSVALSSRSRTSPRDFSLLTSRRRRASVIKI